jgi:hypothetical protein
MGDETMKPVVEGLCISAPCETKNSRQRKLACGRRRVLLDFDAKILTQMNFILYSTHLGVAWPTLTRVTSVAQRRSDGVRGAETLRESGCGHQNTT